LPAQFSVYIAMQEKGNKDIFGPMSFIDSDKQLDFWIPMHKLFNRQECIWDLNLNIKLESLYPGILPLLEKLGLHDQIFICWISKILWKLDKME
jgi:hypothetical protein